MLAIVRDRTVRTPVRRASAPRRAANGQRGLLAAAESLSSRASSTSIAAASAAPEHDVGFLAHVAGDAVADALRRVFRQGQQFPARGGDPPADDRAERARERLLDEQRKGQREVGQRLRQCRVAGGGDQLRPAAWPRE
jgi:primosomal protein N''